MIKSPLIPVIIEGSATKVTRGWNQLVEMNPEFYSVDPDDPTSRVMSLLTSKQTKKYKIPLYLKFQFFEYEWYCRKVYPEVENYTQIDAEGFPMSSMPAHAVPPPGQEAQLFNTPPGCFGKGAGRLSRTAGRWTFNTSSFVAYGQSYEFLLVLKKDDR